MTSKGGKRPTLRADKRYSKTPSKSKATAKKAKPAPKKPAKTAARRKPARRRSTRRPGILGWFAWLIRAFFRLIWGITWRITAVAALVLGAVVFYFYAQLPPFTEMIDGRTRGSVTMLDRNGEVFAWRGETFESITDIDQVSEHLKNAVIATEDRRFYWHMGISPRGIASAVRINLSEGRGALQGHGGSTLTQQTAKLLCLGVPYDPEIFETEADYEADCRRTTIGRKAKEAVYSLAMELKYTKDEILVIYFNRAYLGASARGFEAAAQRYFGITSAELSPAQAAMLAGLLKAPTRYAPTNSLSRSQDRADTVVKLMFDQGYLTAAQRDDAWDNPATLSEAAEARKGGYFADWVMDTMPAFFGDKTTEDIVAHTTFDQKIQNAIEESMHQVFETKVSEGSEAQAAIIVMSGDGAVRAMLGGRDTKVSGAFNRATHAKRQTGSSFKPFVYAAAMEQGFSPNDTVADVPTCWDVPGSGQYCPQNYTKKFHGPVTLTEALAKSLNVPAVRVSEGVGREIVQQTARGFGITGDLADGPALALGASESTLVEMTGAYAGFLNGGYNVKPYGVNELRLNNDNEPLMGKSGGFGQPVISDFAAAKLVYMMTQVIESGTGTRARLEGRPAAGKTGTTQAARDAWFIGFTGDYVAGVWMGYDDNTPLKGVTGGGLPAEIWRDAMTRIHQGLPVTYLPSANPDATGMVSTPAGPVQGATPRFEGNTSTARSGGGGGQQPPENPIDRVIRDVLGIFGGN